MKQKNKELYATDKLNKTAEEKVILHESHRLVNEHVIL
jgi:hypothetical protein